jgi:tripartite-type tricarboxylate transporter receptor subunit TctC
MTVAHSVPDGYTLLMISVGSTVNAALYETHNYNLIRDIAPVAVIIGVPLVLENRSFPAKTVLEFITYAKANPGKINYASAGVGTVQHVSAELFKAMTGVNMLHVPYRGSKPALTDLLGGHVQVMFDTMPASMKTSGAASCVLWR